MSMMPKRVKFRKQQRGKMKGNATRGNYVSYGDYGLQSLETHWLSARQIDAGRIAAQHFLRRQGKLFNRGRGRYCWVTVIPLAFLVVIELTAGFQNIRDNYLPKGLWLNIAITGFLMTGLVVVVAGSARRWITNGRRSTED